MKLKVNAPLDPGFMPMAVVYRNFEAAVKAEGGEKLTIGLERNDGLPLAKRMTGALYRTASLTRTIYKTVRRRNDLALALFADRANPRAITLVFAVLGNYYSPLAPLMRTLALCGNTGQLTRAKPRRNTKNTCKHQYQRKCFLNAFHFSTAYKIFYTVILSHDVLLCQYPYF